GIIRYGDIQHARRSGWYIRRALWFWTIARYGAVGPLGPSGGIKRRGSANQSLQDLSFGGRIRLAEHTQMIGAVYYGNDRDIGKGNKQVVAHLGGRNPAPPHTISRRRVLFGWFMVCNKCLLARGKVEFPGSGSQVEIAWSTEGSNARHPAVTLDGE